MTADSRKRETEYLNLKNNRNRCKEINWKTKSTKHVLKVPLAERTTQTEENMKVS